MLPSLRFALALVTQMETIVHGLKCISTLAWKQPNGV